MQQRPAPRRRSLIARAFRSIIAVIVGAYLLVVVGMMLAQRQILYAMRDQGGALANAGGIAVPGSERVAIATSDGETLAAWYIRPQRQDAPVFLFFHGQGGGLVLQVTRWARLREMGAGVLAVAYRGYPGSTGSPSEKGLILDARAAYDWLRARHAARDIVLHGHSLGSGVATALAETVEARALILEAPFTAAVDVAAERYPFLPVHWLMFDQYRSRDVAPRVTMPTLIVHGDADTVIRFQHAERLVGLFAGPKKLVRVRGGGHNSLSRDGLYDHVRQFLAEHPAKR